MDYHIDWLVGALCLFQLRSTVLDDLEPQDNKETSHLDEIMPKPVSGSQEDFDLVLAGETTIVCTEAKWFDAWDDDALNDKIRAAKQAAVLANSLAKSKRYQPRELCLYFCKLILGNESRDGEKLVIGRHPNKHGSQRSIRRADPRAEAVPGN